MSGPTTVDTVYSNPQNDAEVAVNNTVDEINELYDIMYKVGISQDDVDDCISKMENDSNSSDWYAAGTNAVNLDMGLALLAEANTIAGGLCFLSQCINVIASITDLATIADNAFMDMCNNADDNSFGTSAEGTEDALELQESLNAFNETVFTITYADGSSKQVNGVLNLLSNNSLDEGNEEMLWGNSGLCPMDATSASLVNTSVEGITDTFTNWNDSSTYFKDIQEWAGTTNGTGTSEGSTEYIQETSSEISDISNSFGQIDSQLQTNCTEISNDLSYGMTLYEQLEATISEVLSPDLANYIVSQSGH